MTVTDWIQAISMAVLVAITAIYAWRTHVISEAAKRQADASVAMAKEMENQRKKAVMPILGCQVTEAAWENGWPANQGWSPKRVRGKLTNGGLGPALNVKWTLASSKTQSLTKQWAIMEKGATFFDQDFVFPDEEFKTGSEKVRGVDLKFDVSWEDVYGSKFHLENTLQLTDGGLKDGALKIESDDIQRD